MCKCIYATLLFLSFSAAFLFQILSCLCGSSAESYLTFLVCRGLRMLIDPIPFEKVFLETVQLSAEEYEKVMDVVEVDTRAAAAE